MTNRIVLSTVIAAIFCALTGAQAAGTDSGASAGNPVIARGTGFEITRRDLDDAMAKIKQPIPSAQILNSLIDTKLLLSKTTDADKAAGKNAADLHMTALLENLGQEKLDQQLKAAGETADEERSKFADQITVQTMLLRELKINVSDDDVKKFFDDHRISAFARRETPDRA